MLEINRQDLASLAGGLPLRRILDVVLTRPNAERVVFDGIQIQIWMESLLQPIWLAVGRTFDVVRERFSNLCEFVLRVSPSRCTRAKAVDSDASKSTDISEVIIH